jgi:cytosine/adenosine deaminase-related metal-dependent hydrolase
MGTDITIPDDVEVIDVTGKILTPSFVNTHSHMWETALRTLGPDATLAQYFFNYSQASPIAKSFSPEDVYISSLAGYAEGLNAGVTTFMDHAHNSWNLDAVQRGFDATNDSGGGRVWWCPAAADAYGQHWRYYGCARGRRVQEAKWQVGTQGAD